MNSTAPVHSHTTPTSYLGAGRDALNRVLAPEVNLAIWQRESGPCQQAAKGLLKTSFKSEQFVYNRKDPVDLIGAHLDEATELKSKKAPFLWNDIMDLAAKMLELCDDQEIGLCLDRVTNDNCTAFHTDFLNLRLLCTYWGDATYWIENPYVNREGLGQNNNDLVVKDWEQVHQMKTNWAGIFKGDNFPKSKGQGIVHRSPEISTQANGERLLLRIDTIKSFGRPHAE